MESGTEVLRVVAAIITTFQTAAELLEHIKDCKEKKKRKRDREVEELLEIKILHKSLVQGGVQCRRHCENRQSRFSPAFENGDAIALLALKDVVIALQTEVIHGLHLARAVENSFLDFTTLHEASVTCRKDTMRAMDQLCQRIMASVEYLPRDRAEEHSGMWSSSASRVQSERETVLQSPGLRTFAAAPLPLHTERSLLSLPAVLGQSSPDIPQPTYRTLPRRAMSIPRSIETASLKPWHSGKISTSRPGSGISEPSRLVLTAPTSPDVSHSNSDRVSSPDSHPNKDLQSNNDDFDTHRTSVFSIQSSVFALGGESVPEDLTHTGTASIATLQSVRDISAGKGPRQRHMNFGVCHPQEATDHHTADDFHGGAGDRISATSSGVGQMARGPTSQTQGESPVFSLTTTPNFVPEKLNRNEISSWKDSSLSHFTIDSGPYFNSGPYFSENELVVSRSMEPRSEIALNQQDATYTMSSSANQQYRPRALHSGKSSPEQDQSTNVPRLVRMSSEPADVDCAEARSLSLDRLMASNQSPASVTSGWDVQFNEKLRPMPDLANEKFSASLTQADYQERLSTLPRRLENIWLPLARPALHNRYHGFCKGAWQIRGAVDEGLRVLLTPRPNHKEPILDWQCTACNFRSRAPTADALPDYILFNQKHNVRYRWLFLANSHCSAPTSFDSPDNYAYGCIFCAAQGHPTSTHEKLEHLLVHILAKHKASMLTPEVKSKVRCVTGALLSSQAQEWDINVPDLQGKRVGTTANELRVSAGKFWNRRKDTAYL
ncbi:hypothetical protein MBLNU13_g06652t1 [Cladosporium sp. NU13]